MSNYAIIPAAGLSTRMGSTTSGQTRKPLIEIGGAPILIHTLRKWNQIPGLRKILVPARPEDRDQILASLEAEHARTPPSVPIEVIEGGLTRQDSVWNAVEAIAQSEASRNSAAQETAKRSAAVPDAADDPLVAVHDAVRPFVAAATVEAAFAAAAKYAAVIVALPAVDTVKQVERSAGDQNRIVATLQRERIILAQTPQVFRLSLLREAYRQARADGFHGTDEAALVEHLGRDVFVVPGDARNWKITTPADLPLAELFLRLPR